MGSSCSNKAWNFFSAHLHIKSIVHCVQTCISKLTLVLTVVLTSACNSNSLPASYALLLTHTEKTTVVMSAFRI